MAKTASSRTDIGVSFGHEMVHRGVMGALDLVQKGKAEGMLTPKQIEAVQTLLSIYDKVKGEPERFMEETYGLKNAQEFAAQMIDPRQRKALDRTIFKCIMDAVDILRASGEKTLWQKVKDAVRTLDEFISQSAVDKSESKDVHMAVLKVLPEVLKTSIDVETHPDFLKGEDGKRSAENGMNKDVLVHRCYGAVEMDGKIHRGNLR